jgi:hypothetical protein
MGFALAPLQQATNNLPFYIKETYHYSAPAYTVFLQMDLDFTDINVLHCGFTHKSDAGNSSVRGYVDSDIIFTSSGQVDGTSVVKSGAVSTYTGIHEYTLYILEGGGATEVWTEDLTTYVKLQS